MTKRIEEMEGMLYLEDGTVFKGKGFGCPTTAVGELVFNTSMTGYQKILTDPSYRGQIINMTYPLMGNYGVSAIDNESPRIHAFGLVIRDLCRQPSNSHSIKTLDQWLVEQKIPGVYGVDSRQITRKIRRSGTVKCLISTEGISISQARELCRQAVLRGDWMKEAAAREKYVLEPLEPMKPLQPLQAQLFKEETSLHSVGFGTAGQGSAVSGNDGRTTAGRETAVSGNDGRTTAGQGTRILSETEGSPGDVRPTDDRQGSLFHRGPFHVAVLDFGVKAGILKCLRQRNCRLTVYPYGTAAEEILAEKPDGIFLTNGPGNPEEAAEAIEEVRKLIRMSEAPMFGICMGHQILALALGGKTYKLKYGHRGGNHGVFDKGTKRSYITSQNHGYAVQHESIILKGMEVTHLNLNDGTVEGMEHRDLPIFSVQFHPEASPGPNDNAYLFDKFIGLMKEGTEHA